MGPQGTQEPRPRMSAVAVGRPPTERNSRAQGRWPQDPLHCQGLRTSGAVPTFSKLWEGCGREGKVRLAGCRSHREAPLPSQPHPRCPHLRRALPGGQTAPLQPFHIVNLVHLDLEGLLQCAGQGWGQVHPLPREAGLAAQGGGVGHGGLVQPSPLQTWNRQPGAGRAEARSPAPSLATALTGRAHRGPIPKCSA